MLASPSFDRWIPTHLVWAWERCWPRNRMTAPCGQWFTTSGIYRKLIWQSFIGQAERNVLADALSRSPVSREEEGFPLVVEDSLVAAVAGPQVASESGESGPIGIRSCARS